jgi:hypothetical protein
VTLDGLKSGYSGVIVQSLDLAADRKDLEINRELGSDPFFGLCRHLW